MPTADNPRGLAIADFDHDNQLDFATANNYANNATDSDGEPLERQRRILDGAGKGTDSVEP